MTILILNNINEQHKNRITKITSGVICVGQLFNFLKVQICLHSHTHEETHFFLIYDSYKCRWSQAYDGLCSDLSMGILDILACLLTSVASIHVTKVLKHRYSIK